MNPIGVIRHQVHGTDGRDLGDVLYVWCPGCDSLHGPCVRKGVDERPVWTWNGDLDAPGVEPSILVTLSWNHPDTGPQERRCHSFLRDGRWQFLTDSTHDLAGKTVDAVPLPDWVVSESSDAAGS